MTAESRSLRSAHKPLAFDPIAEAGRQWATRWGETAVPAMMAVTSVMRVQQILMSRLHQLLKPFGLTFPRYEALMLLYMSRSGALPLGKMGARLQVHPTSVTNLIDGLERGGLLRREQHASDRRKTLAAITKDGREVAEAATLVLNEAGFGTEPLGEHDAELLTTTLRSVRVHNGDFVDNEDV
jgi:DNA-binding MarR family transcriptional regulator